MTYLRVAVLLGIAGMTGGCLAFGHAVKPVTDVLDAGLMSLEPDFPPQSEALRGASTDAVLERANSADIWGALEIARRFEQGDRIAKDARCAYFWYETATVLPYPVGPTAYPTMRTNHASAKKGMERLSGNPEVVAGLADGAGRDQRCRSHSEQAGSP
jgi:hypothetical protein